MTSNPTLTQHLSGKLDHLRVHRPTPEQRAANLLLPPDEQILGPVVHEERDIGNLVLNCYSVMAAFYASSSAQFFAMESSTPNYDDMDGTYSQSGTTLTRASGSGVFAAGDVGKEVKFGTGQRCHIVTFTNTTTVTVSKSQTVAATTLRRYFTTATSTGYKQFKSSTAPVKTVDYSTGIGTLAFSVIMDAAAVAYSLNSVIIDQLARVVLPVPVAVQEFDQISMSYTLQMVCTGRETHDIVLSQAIAGYPVAYPVAAISGNGTTLTVTNTGSHHYLAGDEIVISNAVPLRKAVASASASGSAWTINATAHGFSPADTVVHEGFSASGYNGTYTVASVTNANTYTVTSAATPGASTGGTTRFATPAGYFDGTYTVATAPNVTTVTIASSKTGPAVDPTAILTSPDIATETIYGNVFGLNLNSSPFQFVAWNKANKKIIPAVTTQNPIPVTGNSYLKEGANYGLITVPNSSNDWELKARLIAIQAWGVGGGEPRVAQMNLSLGSNQGECHFIEFRTPQPKLSTHRLAPPAIRMQITRDLP